MSAPYGSRSARKLGRVGVRALLLLALVSCGSAPTGQSAEPIATTDTLIAICDSNTTGDASQPNNDGVSFSWVDYLWTAYGARIQKAAVNGAGLFWGAYDRVLEDVKRYLDAGVPPESLTVVSLCGSNDAMQPYSAEEIVTRYAALRDALAALDVTMVELSIPPMTPTGEVQFPGVNAKIDEINEGLRAAMGDHMIEIDIGNKLSFPGSQPPVLRDDVVFLDEMHLDIDAQVGIAHDVARRLNEMHAAGII